MRAIRAAAIVRPVWRRGPLAVEGPDEDAFTLAVAALEALGERPALGGRPFARVHLVGPVGEAELPAVGEALGESGLEVRHAVGGTAELLQALATATGSGGAIGPEAVVAVDVARGLGPFAHGAGAIALAVEEGSGLAVGVHGERHHPVERPPEASRWVETVRRAVPLAPGAAGVLYVRAEAAAPVLFQAWEREVPSFPVEMAPAREEGIGPAPHVGPALDLLAAAGLDRPGTGRLLAEIRPGRTVFGGFSADAPIDVATPAAAAGAELTWPGRTSVEEAALRGRVAEGAYLPRARYLESRPSRWRFVADRCGACGAMTFPARGSCRGCGREDQLRPELLPRDGGTVEARTTVRPGAQPTEFDPAVEASGGYDVVLVRLVPGVLATLQVTDAAAGSTPLGATVATRLRRLYPMEGEWRYGRKAIPRPAA